VKLREYLPLALAVIALLLAVAQSIHPFGFNVHPVLLLVVAFLLGLRHVMRHQKRNREDLLKSVPQQPLGLGEPDDQRTKE
jgi:membrane protein required for beta-lactamase induction